MININYNSPIRYNTNLSKKYKSNIIIKYENELPGNSFNYRLYSKLLNKINKDSVFVCYELHINTIIQTFHNTKKKIYIFTTNSNKNKNKNKNKNLKIKYNGSNLLETIKYAKKFSNDNNLVYIDTFENSKFLDYYNDLGEEIINNIFFKNNIDYIFLSGCNIGLVKSLSNFFNKKNKKTKIISVRFNKKNKEYQQLIFKNFRNKNIINKSIEINDLYNFIHRFYISDSFLIEETSAMSIAALNSIDIKGKNIICIITDKIKNLKSIEKILNKN